MSEALGDPKRAMTLFEICQHDMPTDISIFVIGHLNCLSTRNAQENDKTRFVQRLTYKNLDCSVCDTKNEK